MNGLIELGFDHESGCRLTGAAARAHYGDKVILAKEDSNLGSTVELELLAHPPPTATRVATYFIQLGIVVLMSGVIWKTAY